MKKKRTPRWNYIVIKAVLRKEENDRYGELRGLSKRYFISIIICSLAETSIARCERHSL